MCRLLAAITLCLALLAGCAGGGFATHTFIFNRDVRGHVQYAAAHGPTTTVIYNDPFPDDASGAAVIAAMQGRNPGPPITFAAGAPGGSGYSVVVAFGQPPAGRNDYCRASTPPPRPAAASGRTEASAAFCVDGSVISEAAASGDAIASPKDPRLVRMMQDLLYALMPYNDPLNMNDSSDMGM